MNHAVYFILPTAISLALIVGFYRYGHHSGVMTTAALLCCYVFLLYPYVRSSSLQLRLAMELCSIICCIVAVMAHPSFTSIAFSRGSTMPGHGNGGRDRPAIVWMFYVGALLILAMLVAMIRVIISI